MRPGQRVLAFDRYGWWYAGRVEEDREHFWKPATVIKVYESTVTIKWDDPKVRNTCHNHLPHHLQLIGEN